MSKSISPVRSQDGDDSMEGFRLFDDAPEAPRAEVRGILPGRPQGVPAVSLRG